MRMTSGDFFDYGISLIEELIRNLSKRYTDEELEYFVENGFIKSWEFELILLRRRMVKVIRRSKGSMRVINALFAHWEHLQKQRVRIHALYPILQKCRQKTFLLIALWSCKIKAVCEELEFPRGRAPPLRKNRWNCYNLRNIMYL